MAPSVASGPLPNKFGDRDKLRNSEVEFSPIDFLSDLPKGLVRDDAASHYLNFKR